MGQLLGHAVNGWGSRSPSRLYELARVVAVFLAREHGLWRRKLLHGQADVRLPTDDQRQLPARTSRDQQKSQNDRLFRSTLTAFIRCRRRLDTRH